MMFFGVMCVLEVGHKKNSESVYAELSKVKEEML